MPNLTIWEMKGPSVMPDPVYSREQVEQAIDNTLSEGVNFALKSARIMIVRRLEMAITQAFVYHRGTVSDWVILKWAKKQLDKGGYLQ